MEYFHNGKWYAGKEPMLPASDLGVARAYAVFDFLRTYEKKPFCLEEHLTRFYHSAKLSSLQIPCSKQTILDAVYSLIEKQNEDSGIKLLLTAGGKDSSFRYENQEQLYIFAQKIYEISEEKKQEGIGVNLLWFERPFPLVKSTFYFPALQHLDRRCEEIVYVDSQGNITEGSTSNIFLIKNKHLITPEKNIVKGITRDVILNHLPHDLDIQIRDVSLQELLDADEAFLCSTTKEILPIRFILNQKTFSSFPITHQLKHLFTHYVRGSICVG